MAILRQSMSEFCRRTDKTVAFYAQYKPYKKCGVYPKKVRWGISKNTLFMRNYGEAEE